MEKDRGRKNGEEEKREGEEKEKRERQINGSYKTVNTSANA